MVALAETRHPHPGETHWRDLGLAFVPTPLRLVAAVHDRRIGLYLTLFFFQFTSFAVLEGQITYFLSAAHGADELDVALVFAWIGLILALTQGVALRRLVPVVGEERLVMLGLGTMGVGLMGVAVAGSLGWFYLVGSLIAFGNGVAFPTFTGLYSKACESEQAGELLAQSQSMATTGRIVGPVAAGWMMEHGSLGTPFLIAGAVMFGCLICFSLSRRILIEGLP